ncbi:MAG: DUF4091 domain-containing protein, partial [Thermoguttaceae bacterium]|nr:DUF4091 domain-containing protein [Thermoguttaceae bacterium]
VCSTTDIANVALSVTPLVHEDGKATIAADQIRLRPIRLVPIATNTADANKVIVRKAPCDIPDVLMEDQTINLQKGQAKGIWLTVFVPAGSKPGRYTATISLTAGAVSAKVPLEMNVFTFTLPSERHLWVTNWYSPSYIAKYHKTPIWSEAFWTVLEKYFKNMGEHRQNVIYTRWIPDNHFVKAVRKADGTWKVDFSNLDRYLKLAEKYQVGERIEFTHCGGLKDGKINYQSAAVFDEKANKVMSVGIDEWQKPVLAALEQWLIETKRIDRAMMHVADEPHMFDMTSWREASHRLHEYAPKIKRIDAIESVNFTDELEVWVPKLTHFDRWRGAFEDRRNQGEMWYYICCHPTGNHYPNRFMDLPGTRVRALHWINYTEKLCGYLHWGLNFWPSDPFGTPYVNYGPGDSHTIYPGPLDSIRWEIERESLEDYEYLVLLEQMTAKVKKESKADLWWLDANRRSMELGRKIIRSLSDTELDPKKYAAVRDELAREIQSFENGPRLFVQTFPEDNGVMYTGPVLAEVYGMTTPGALITINGKNIGVNSEGLFRYTDWTKTSHKLEIIATLNGKTTKTVRSFEIR